MATPHKATSPFLSDAACHNMLQFTGYSNEQKLQWDLPSINSLSGFLIRRLRLPLLIFKDDFCLWWLLAKTNVTYNWIFWSTLLIRQKTFILFCQEFHLWNIFVLKITTEFLSDRKAANLVSTPYKISSVFSNAIKVSPLGFSYLNPFTIISYWRSLQNSFPRQEGYLSSFNTKQL